LGYQGAQRGVNLLGIFIEQLDDDGIADRRNIAIPHVIELVVNVSVPGKNFVTRCE
jgi:hypothetical protein